MKNPYNLKRKIDIPVIMAKETKNNKILLIIIFSVIFFIAGGIAGYFIGMSSHHMNSGRNNFMQIDSNTQAQVTSVFENAASINDINTYCDTNSTDRFACMYYCRTINPQNQFCSQLNLGYGVPGQ